MNVVSKCTRQLILNVLCALNKNDEMIRRISQAQDSMFIFAEAVVQNDALNALCRFFVIKGVEYNAFLFFALTAHLYISLSFKLKNKVFYINSEAKKKWSITWKQKPHTQFESAEYSKYAILLLKRFPNSLTTQPSKK